MDEFPSGTNMIVAVLAYTGTWSLPVQITCYPGMLAVTAMCSSQ